MAMKRPEMERELGRVVDAFPGLVWLDALPVLLSTATPEASWITLIATTWNTLAQHLRSGR